MIKIKSLKHAAFRLTFALLLFSAYESSATHLRSIKVEVQQISGLTYSITVTAYVDLASTTQFGNGQLRFGDGISITTPKKATTPRPDLGPGIGVTIFQTTHTYVANGTYTISYREGDRSGGIINIFEAFDAKYYTYVTINTNFPANHFPTLQDDPVYRACKGQTFTFNASATDGDGDSLSYELTVPEQNENLPVDGYVSPDAPIFYPVNYATANEDGTGPPTFSINDVTGTITWDAPGAIGEYNIAFKIKEWRAGVLLSTTICDFQIVVSECQNLRPVLNIPNTICVEAETIVEYNITGSDPENKTVKLEAVSDIFDFDESPATYSPNPSVFSPSPGTLHFYWKTDCVHAREQFYQVNFKASDKPILGTSLTTFKSWNIKVLAPAPTWISVEPDLVNRYAVLKWNDYTCQNAESIQVWRRVGSYNYSPTKCDAGLPKFYGYELVASLDPSATEYVDTNSDKGLATAAQYCYRLIAFFKMPSGGSSYVSSEFCMEPIFSDAPVITHVSVDTTNSKAGAIRVSWRSPFKISATQYPRPYKYEIYRADSLTSDAPLLKVGLVTNDTTFLNESINTEKLAYHYQIVIYAIPKDSTEYFPIDTSAIASSVWLTSTPGPKKIELNWNAATPWTNVVQSKPRHLIFRGPVGGEERNMTLIDSVDVSVNGFTYTDEGQFNNQPLKDDEAFSYKVETRGTYGNPNIKLLLNYSQRVNAYPENNLLPCRPVITVDPADCEAFYGQGVCENYHLSNTVHWRPTLDPGCRIDIAGYRLYAANTESDEFKLIATDLTDTIFTESDLLAFARCYRVEAVDGMGHVSELSDAACNDNCLYYELPNVFTPNDDGCNDLLSAFDPNASSNGNTCISLITNRCPSFAEHVKFSVYDRWGKKIYTYSSGNGKSIYIDWDGHDDKGNALESAIYYYTVEVSYAALNPSKKKQRLKGWIQLIR
ncbi:MAG: gliding motility-associated C-terminal domain-containing protein [Chryseolinea sp.]